MSQNPFKSVIPVLLFVGIIWFIRVQGAGWLKPQKPVVTEFGTKLDWVELNKKMAGSDHELNDLLKKKSNHRKTVLEKIRLDPNFVPSFFDIGMLDPGEWEAIQLARQRKIRDRINEAAPIFQDGELLNRVLPTENEVVSNYETQSQREGKPYPAVPSGTQLTLEQLLPAAFPSVPMLRVSHLMSFTVKRIDHNGSPLGNNPERTLTHAFTKFGTGFFVDGSGHIVTNNHVVEPPTNEMILKRAAQILEVVTSANDRFELVADPEVVSAEYLMIHQGKYRSFAKTLPPVNDTDSTLPFQLPVSLIGRDEKSDLAVMQAVDCSFPYLTFANPTELKVGQSVVAVGYPRATAIPGDPTAMPGIVSGLNRSPYGPLQAIAGDSVQHSASIYPGNSGGPLLNYVGEVVGVNTFGLTDSDTQGLNFARGPRTAIPFVEQLIRFGKVSRLRPEFGVVMVDGIGLFVCSCRAEQTVRLGDLILQINGQTVSTVGEWDDILGLMNHESAATINMTVKHLPQTLKLKWDKQEPNEFSHELRSVLNEPSSQIMVSLAKATQL